MKRDLSLNRLIPVHRIWNQLIHNSNGDIVEGNYTLLLIREDGGVRIQEL